MTCHILVVGSGSFIARHWVDVTRHRITAVPHRALETVAGQHFDVVVNCAADPALKAGPYAEQHDRDLRAAQLAAEQGSHFVMLGTRKVYQPSNAGIVLDEASPLGPDGWYGHNKLESEQRVARLLGKRATLLRIANVYGREYGRRSFFGMATTRLRDEGRIVLDVSPFTKRDFIPVSLLCELLDAVCAVRPAGVHNLGSGIGLPLGRIAEWLIQGHGRGVLEIVDTLERDAFVMNPAKLLQALGLPTLNPELEPDIRSIGRQLHDE